MSFKISPITSSTVKPFDLVFRAQNQTMFQHRQGHGFDVIRRDEITAVDRRMVRLARINAWVARGPAPTRTLGCRRVCRTISTMYPTALLSPGSLPETFAVWLKYQA